MNLQSGSFGTRVVLFSWCVITLTVKGQLELAYCEYEGGS